MKHLANSIIAIAWFLSPPLTHAQGTAYLSNLGQPSAGTEPVGTDSWIAQQFGTGNNPGGYLLDSVQLLMTPATGSPSGFTVELYSHRAGSLLPGDRLGLLTGPDPAAGGTFSYSGSGLVLLPTTAYFLVVSAATPISDGAYFWSYGSTSSADSNDNWKLLTPQWSTADGVNWQRHVNEYLQLGLDATAVPEPSSWILLALGLAGFGLWRNPSRR